MATELFSKLESSYGLPGGLLDSIWSAESSRGRNMRSPAGAQGHFQFMPATAKQYGLADPNDLTQSAMAAARFLSDLHKKYRGDLPKVLAAYNWGGGNVDRKGLDKAPAETRNYITKVSASMTPNAPENTHPAGTVRTVPGRVSTVPGTVTAAPDEQRGRDLAAELFGDAKPQAQAPARDRGAELAAELFGESKPATQPITKGERFTKGLRDPVDAGAQFITNLLPAGVVEAGNTVNNWLAEKTGLVARLPAGGVDQQVREDEKLYQERRAATPGAGGIDWMRIGGNVFNPANVGIAANAPRVATFAGRVGVGAAGGAASSVFSPVTSGVPADFWTEKGKQAVVGGIAGGAVPAVVGGVSRLVSPNASTNPNVLALRAEGIRPTVGQTLGGMANRVEEKLTSVPLVGDMISNARRGAAQDMNRAAFNRALAPINQQLPRNLSGREAVEFTEEAISNGYNRILPNLTARADQPFTASVAQVQQMVNNGAVDPNAINAFNRILQNDVLGKFGGVGAVTGQTWKQIESDLGVHIRRLANTQDADQRLIGDALEEVQHQLRQMLARSNPNQARELGALNTAWANFKRVQRAAAGLGAEEGIFSPAQLQNAVKALDRSKDKAAFARGNALMQDLSEPAKTVLGNRVPDSGTPGRIAVGGGLSFLDPTGIAPFLIGGGAAAYLRPTQNALASLIAARPQAAQPVANALRQSSPVFVPLGAQIGLNALNQ